VSKKKTKFSKAGRPKKINLKRKSNFIKQEKKEAG